MLIMRIAAKPLVYKDLSYKLNGLFFEVQNGLGRFSSEHQYCDALEELLREEHIPYAREKEIFIPFGKRKIGGNRVDFLITDKVLVDIKAKKYITREDYLQMRRYLRASGVKLGLIANFRGKSVVIKRVINPGAGQLAD